MNRISHVLRSTFVCIILSVSAYATSDGITRDVQMSEHTCTQPLFQEHQCTVTRTYRIASISQEAIDKQHQELVAELKVNTLARYGIKAATAALAMYVVYELWLARTGNKEYVVPAIDGFGLSNAQLTAALYEINPPRFSWQWFKNGASSIGWSVINIALAKGVFDRGERFVDSVMHDGNLDWFIKTHTNIVTTLVELTEYAHAHDARGASLREHEHHKEQLMYVTTSFMNHMTAILGYMNYSKSVVLDPDVRVHMHTLIDYCRISCNECVDAISTALEADSAVTPHVAKMNVELDRVVRSFMRLEKEQGAR